MDNEQLGHQHFKSFPGNFNESRQPLLKSQNQTVIPQAIIEHQLCAKYLLGFGLQMRKVRKKEIKKLTTRILFSHKKE